MTRGLIIGKFYPPHAGHKLLIDTAARQVDSLTVIVCDKVGQWIPGRLRARWLREIHPGVRVLCVPDELDDDDTPGWAAATVGWLGGPPDVVFSSEEYGEPYARAMGSRHVRVNPGRLNPSTSGTAIRADPYAHWDALQPPVRAFFAKRVAIVGAESTGSTTLARGLADHYQTAWVPEVGRTYSDGKQPSGAPWQSHEFITIARMQNALEDEFARSANRLLICDTDVLATTIWHERYMGFPLPRLRRLVRRHDLYLVTSPDIPFVQDGLRDGEHLREWMHNRFVAAVANRRHLVLTGSHDERLVAATAAIDQLLGAPFLPLITV